MFYKTPSSTNASNDTGDSGVAVSTTAIKSPARLAISASVSAQTFGFWDIFFHFLILQGFAYALCAPHLSGTYPYKIDHPVSKSCFQAIFQDFAGNYFPLTYQVKVCSPLEIEPHLQRQYKKKAPQNKQWNFSDLNNVLVSLRGPSAKQFWDELERMNMALEKLGIEPY